METDEDKKQFLQIIYENTGSTRDPEMKLYNTLNVATLILGIRHAIILGVKLEDLPQFIGLFQERGFDAKKYPIGTNIIIKRRDVSQNIQEAYNRIKPPTPPAPTNEIPDPNNETPQNRFHKNTGITLGYLQPIALRRYMNYPVSVQIEININDKGKKYSISFFPQRVSSISPEFRERLESMKTRIETEIPSILPEGITLESVTVKTEGSPRGIGGRHRKFKATKKSKGYLRRSSRKGRGSS